MTVRTLDLAVPKGQRVIQPIQVTTNGSATPLPVGTTAKMQIRSSPKSLITLAELTTENAQIIIDLASALVTIQMSSTITAAFAFERAMYDLELIYSNGEKDRIVEGRVYVLPSVTQ